MQSLVGLSETYQEFIEKSSNLEITGDAKAVGLVSRDGALEFDLTHSMYLKLRGMLFGHRLPFHQNHSS